MSALSIVVPVRAEDSGFKPFLLRLLEAVAPLNGSEIIVVDGTAGAGISAICRSTGVCVIRSGGGRLAQMTRGAALAQGEYLLFADPEITLPANFADLWRSIRRRGSVWGFFSLRFHRAPLKLRWLARVISLRSRISGVAVEDQPLFVQRNAWKLAGEPDTTEPPHGYFGLCRRLSVITAPSVIRQPVENQSARWRQAGLREVLFAGLSSRLHLGVERPLSEFGGSLGGKVKAGRKRTPEMP